MVTSFKTINISSFCFLYRGGRKVKEVLLFTTLEYIEEITNKCGGRCLEEAAYSLNDVIFCASWRFCEEVASSKDSHGSKMLQRLSIFAILEIVLKILNPQQNFRIVKMSMKILYLHWVEGTPQLCQFPGVSFTITQQITIHFYNTINQNSENTKGYQDLKMISTNFCVSPTQKQNNMIIKYCTGVKKKSQVRY